MSNSDTNDSRSESNLVNCGEVHPQYTASSCVLPAGHVGNHNTGKHVVSGVEWGRRTESPLPSNAGSRSRADVMGWLGAFNIPQHALDGLRATFDGWHDRRKAVEAERDALRVDVRGFINSYNRGEFSAETALVGISEAIR